MRGLKTLTDALIALAFSEAAQVKGPRALNKIDKFWKPIQAIEDWTVIAVPLLDVPAMVRFVFYFYIAKKWL